MLEVATFYPLIEPEELEILIRGALEETFERYGFLLPPEGVADEDKAALRALAKSRAPDAAAEAFGVPVDDLGAILGRLKNLNLLPQRSLAFQEVSRAAAAVHARIASEDRLRRVEAALARIEERLGAR